MSRERHVLIDDDKRFEEVVGALANADIYAIDTEFVRERTFFPVLAVVQVAWPGGVALLDAMALDLSPLKGIFEGSGLALVHAGSQDIPILNAACGAVPGRLFDTQVAGAFLHHGIASLASLVERELGLRLEKGSQLTDWTRRPLDDKALRYAASDVTHLHDLYDVTCRALEKRGRLSWVEEECEALRVRELQTRDLDEAWWKLKGKAKLRGDARGVAQALCRFRLEEAASRNIPAKRVLSDMAILGMAGRPPRNGRDLERIRGLGSMPRDLANKVLSAVRRGQEMATGDLRLPPKKPSGEEKKAAANLCLAWVHQLAADHGIEASMVATRDDVQSFLRGKPSRLATGWRHALTADGLDALSTGKAALGLMDGELSLVRLG